jgi:nucleotide-binding universal stress UspA family protein
MVDAVKLPATSYELKGKMLMTTRRRILIAVDGSPHSLHAVNYVAALSSQSPVQVSLLHVLPTASEELLWQINADEDFKSRIKAKYDEFNEECKREAGQFLDRAKRIVADSASSPEGTVTILQQWQSGIARDIIAEAQKGYDAVVVGRRGVGKFENLLMGSVTTKVVHGIEGTPVWIIGGEILPAKMLIAVDDSPYSRKAVIYASHFAADTGAEVMLFHAIRKFFLGTGERFSTVGEEIETALKENLKDKIQRMFDDYSKCLVAGGVGSEKISIKCNFGSLGRAADILDTARADGCGTIVMGRRGISAVRELIMGRVTAKVLNGAEGLALWIVP